MLQLRPSSNPTIAAASSRGQSTVEFALVLPLVVFCVGILLATVVACLTTLQLNDFARLTARTVATSTDVEQVTRDYEAQCACDIQITTEANIITVRAEKPFAMPIFAFPLPLLRLHGKSFAMKEPTVTFRAAT